MRLCIDAGLLRKHLEVVKPRRSESLAIFRAVNLVVCDVSRRLSLSTKGDDRYLCTSLPIDDCATGEQAVVDWFELYERLRGQKGPVTLEGTISRSEDEALKDRRHLDILVQATGARTRLPAVDPDDIPRPCTLHPGHRHYRLQCPLGNLLDALSRALPVVTRDDPRLHLRGVHVQSSCSRLDSIHLAATDGARRVLVEDFDCLHSEGDWEFLLPERFCRDLLRTVSLLKPKRSTEIGITADCRQQSDVEEQERQRESVPVEDVTRFPAPKVDAGRVQAVFGDIEIMGTTPEGRFPFVERLMPDKEAATARALVNRRALIAAMGAERPRPCIGSYCVDSVSLHFAPLQLGVVFRPGTEGIPIVSILASEEGAGEQSIALSAYVLLPALEAISDEEVYLYVSHPLNPVLIEGSRSRAVVSPLRREHIRPIEHPDWRQEPVLEQVA